MFSREQTLGAGTEGVDYDFAIIVGEQEDLRDLGMSEMQGAHHGQVRSVLATMIGVQDSYLDRRRGHATQDIVRVKIARRDPEFRAEA